MADSTQLQTTLEHLREVSRALAHQIDFEMTRLESTGIAPSSKTLSAINDFRASVIALGKAVTPEKNLESLAEIDAALSAAIAATSTREIRARILDPVIALTHVEDAAFRPLDDLQKSAVRLEGEIQRGTASADVLRELASGKHPWCQLLQLVVKGHDLGDAVWGEYYDAVEASLGRQLAIASTRGKLKLPAPLAKVVIGEAPPGPPRESVAVPRAEDLDPLNINRPSRLPVQESREPETIFEGSPFSGIHGGPNESDLAQLDELDDPDGVGESNLRGVADFHALFEELNMDSEASSVTDAPAGLTPIPDEREEAVGDASATASLDSGLEGGSPREAERVGSMNSDSRLVGDEILQHGREFAAAATAVAEASLPRRRPEKFLGTSSAEMQLFPRTASSATASSVATEGGGTQSSFQIPAIGGGRPPAPSEHVDDPEPCPKCGSDTFPAMARCRNCGIVLPKRGGAGEEPNGLSQVGLASTVSGLFRSAPETTTRELLAGAPEAAETHEPDFHLNLVPPSSQEIRTADRSASARTDIVQAPRGLPKTPPADQPPAAAPAVNGSEPTAEGNRAADKKTSGRSSASQTFEVKGPKGESGKLQTICDKCTAEFQVPRALASQPVACPTCGEMTLAPTAEPTDEIDIPITTTDVDITLYTVRQAIEEALTRTPPASLLERVWERPLSKSQWKNLSGAISTLSPTAGPFECERVRPLIDVLGQSGDERAAELLRTKLPEFPPAIQVEAVKALERLRDPAALPQIMRLLYEEKSPAVAPAIAALAALGDTRAVNPLILLAVASPEHRTRVILALAAYGEGVIPDLSVFISGDHADAVRFVAIEALGRLQSPKAIAPLVTALKEGTRFLQRLAAEGLSHVTSKKVIRPLIEALQNPDEMVRVHASAGLRDNPDPKSAKFLVRSLRDKSLDVRKNIVAAIGLCGDETTVNSLKKFLVDPSRDMAVIAAEAIGRLGQNSAVPTLVKMLEEEVAQNEDRGLIQRIFKALHTLKDRRSVVPLIGYLESSDAMIRRRAIEALGPIPDPVARRSLENALRNDRSDEVRAAAALALGEQGQKHAIPALETALAGGERVKMNALQAIGMLQERTSLAKVLPLLGDPSARVRQAAVSCLGGIRNPEATPRLIEMLHDSEPEVRKAVMIALPLLGEKRSEGELLGTSKPKPAAAATSSASISVPTRMPQASSTRQRRSIVSSMTDLTVGLFGNPFSNLGDLPWPKVASIGSGVAAALVAVVFFAVRGESIPPYRRAFVASTTISNDGKWVATGRTSQGIEIWNVESKSIADYKSVLPNRYLTFTTKNDKFACVGGNNVVLVTIGPSGRVTEMKELGSHTGPIKLYNSTLDGKYLLTVDVAMAKVWNLDEGKVAYEFPVGPAFESADAPLTTALVSAAISEDGTHVAIGTQRWGTRIWKSGTLHDKKFPAAADLFRLALNADGSSLLMLQKRGVSTIASVADGKQTKPFSLTDMITYGLYYLDANTVLQVCGDQVVRWDLTKKEPKAFGVDLPGVNALDLRADRKVIVTGNDEAKAALVVDAEAGSVAAKLDVSR